VIPEVDHALRTLIEREAVDPAEVEVAFDAPTKEWASRRNAPTIDVYLYDIREDLRRRERGWLNEYDGDRIRARHMPPRYFKLSYLVAAWTERPEDEHRLLAALMGCFLRFEALPTDVLSGSLATLGLPVPVSVALPPPEDRSFADVWTALGGELKPSLDVVVTAPTDTGRSFPAGPPVEKPTVLVAEGLANSVPRETVGRRPAPGTPVLSRVRKRARKKN
jgi:Pvc16 N-terminal domain